MVPHIRAAGGLVTDGYFGLRTVVGKLPLPESLAGKRCLDPPARALRAIRSVIRPGGQLLSLEATSLALTLFSPRRPMAQLWDWDEQPRWWTPNRAAHRRLVQAAGFEVLDQGGPVFQPFGTLLPRVRPGRGGPPRRRGGRPGRRLRIAARWGPVARVIAEHPQTRTMLYRRCFWNVWHYLLWRSVLAMAGPRWLRRLVLTRHLLTMRARARSEGARPLPSPSCSSTTRSSAGRSRGGRPGTARGCSEAARARPRDGVSSPTLKAW